MACNYTKKIGFPVCKKENFAGLEAHRKRGKSARASPTPHHTLNEERSARFTAQPLSALIINILARSRSNRLRRLSLHDQLRILSFFPFLFVLKNMICFCDIYVIEAALRASFLNSSLASSFCPSVLLSFCPVACVLPIDPQRRPVNRKWIVFLLG